MSWVCTTSSGSEPVIVDAPDVQAAADTYYDLTGRCDDCGVYVSPADDPDMAAAVWPGGAL